MIAAVTALSLSTACGRGGDRAEAEQAVRNYVTKMAEAYRKGSITPVDPFVGDEHGRRLLGLIGVKSDQGIFLDAKVLTLEFTRTYKEGSDWLVETRERWYYADRKMGTGVQVGPDSIDEYAMRYRFSRREGRLILEALEFLKEPVVGRKIEAPKVDTRVMHGLPPIEEVAPKGVPGKKERPADRTTGGGAKAAGPGPTP